VAALALAATQRLIGETLDEKRQRALIDEFFSGSKGGKVVVLEDASFKGESAEVTSALPLSEAEKDAVKKELLAKVSAHAVTFRVDPAILGGLVVKVGDKVLDGSVAAKLEGLRQSIEVELPPMGWLPGALYVARHRRGNHLGPGAAGGCAHQHKRERTLHYRP
jgi:F-type H+-transporting ATPase subunit b